MMMNCTKSFSLSSEDAVSKQKVRTRQRRRKTRHKIKMKPPPCCLFIELFKRKRENVVEQKKHIVTKSKNFFCVTQFDNIVSCCIIIATTISLLSVLILFCDTINAKETTFVISTHRTNRTPASWSLPVEPTTDKTASHNKKIGSALAYKKVVATKQVAAALEEEQQLEDSFDMGQEEEGEFEKQQQRERSQQRQRPQFDLRQESLIIASRWQNEIFLPCKIFGLDEEQTVSIIIVIIAIHHTTNKQTNIYHYYKYHLVFILPLYFCFYFYFYFYLSPINQKLVHSLRLLHLV